MQPTGHSSGICSSTVTTSKGDQVFEHICWAATRKGALSFCVLTSFLNIIHFPALHLPLAGRLQFFRLYYNGQLSFNSMTDTRGTPIMRCLSSKLAPMNFSAIASPQLCLMNSQHYCFESWSTCDWIQFQRVEFTLLRSSGLGRSPTYSTTHVVSCVTDRDNHYLFISKKGTPVICYTGVGRGKSYWWERRKGRRKRKILWTFTVNQRQYWHCRL